MQAMIQNDEEKEWMLPLLQLRDALDVADDIINRLNHEMDQILKEPELVKRLAELGFYSDGASTPQATTEFVRSQRDKWGEIVRAIGIEPE